MQEILNQILSFEYINEILIAVGALLVLIGFFKILRNGLRIILWILLATVGAVGVAYGLDRSSNSFTADFKDELGAFIDPGREFVIEKLQNVCRTLNISDGPQLDLNVDPNLPLKQ